MICLHEVFQKNRVVITLFLLAFSLFYVHSLLVPVSPGRDFSSFISYFVEILSTKPVYQLCMSYRTPVAPILIGTSLKYGGAFGITILASFLYSLSICLVYLIAKRFNRKLALISGIAIICYPQYATFYNKISSDGIFACFFLGWVLHFINTVQKPSVRNFSINGLFLFFLVLTRPVAQSFIVVLVVIPFLSVEFREKIKFLSVFLAIFVVSLLSWSTYNWARYDDFTVSRVGGAVFPLYRMFVYDKLIDLEAGPHSRELGKAIEDHLLSTKLYKAYSIDSVEKFVDSPRNSRMWSDLVGLSDRVWGWDSDYKKLRAVAMENVKKNLFPYIKVTLRWLYGALEGKAVFFTPQIKEDELPESQKQMKEGLPPLSEGQAIPYAFHHWLHSSNDKEFIPDKNSVITRYPEKYEEKLKMHREKVGRYCSLIPSGNGSSKYVNFLNYIIHKTPAPIWFIFISFAGLLFVKDLQNPIVITLLFTISLSLIVTFLGLNSVAEYRLVFDPIFIIFTIILINDIIMKFRKRFF